MIACLSLILLCQLAGEIIVRALHAPVPSAVLGFMLLFGVLLLRDRFAVLARGPLRPGGIEGTAKAMLAHMSLLFVPAGVGVVQKLDLIAAHGVAIALVLAGSVILTLLATVTTFLVVGRMVAPAGERE